MTQFEDEFEETFYFISDTNLRRHLGDALRHAAEIGIIVTGGQYPEPLSRFFYKTSVIHLASIVEACLHFCLTQNSPQGYREEWEYKNIQTIHIIKGGEEEIIAGRRIRRQESAQRAMRFSTLNRVCKEAKIYGEKLYKEIEKVIEMRNTIHLMHLRELSRGLKKKEAEKASKTTSKIIGIVEKKLSKHAHKKS